jgi:hypothetical protein
MQEGELAALKETSGKDKVLQNFHLERRRLETLQPESHNPNN